MSTNKNLEDHLKDFENLITDNILMTKLANKAIVIIRQRTLRGEYLEGSSSNPGQYSTKPLPLPYGKFAQATRKKILKDQIEKGEYKIFTNVKSRNTWIVIKGGYKKFRELAGKDATRVTMTWSGRLLRDIGIIKAEKTLAEIDLLSAEEKQIATYQNILGAGKSKRKHIFMGFTKSEEQDLQSTVTNDITKLILKLK